jgi:hypothetical protein
VPRLHESVGRSHLFLPIYSREGGGDDAKMPFLFGGPTEASLRASFEKRHGAMAIQKLSKKEIESLGDSGQKLSEYKVEIIYAFPRIRGGGRGVRDILVYCGNDESGWVVEFWQRTNSVEIHLTVEKNKLIFINKKGEVVGSMPLKALFSQDD